MTDPVVEPTRIPGLLVLRGGLQHNEDGWFKEDWHREKMVSLGLPDFGPVQHNVTHVLSRGVTRGFQAEPWDRLVSVVSGRAMGAWVDLREGPGFGSTFFRDLDPGTSVFVPRGVANAHQTLKDNTTLTYFLEHHWTPEVRDRSRFINLYDPKLRIPWVFGRDQAIVSRRDELYPPMADVKPLAPRGVLLVGTETSLGHALAAQLPGARGVTNRELSLGSSNPIDLSAFDIIINAHGEMASGFPMPAQQRESWTQAAARAQHLADIAHRHNLRYVHVSTECKFTRQRPEHGEGEELDLNHPHGKVLAAGELVAAGVPRSLVIRTGWVVGERDGFIDQIARLARRRERAQVVSGTPGRLTFVSQLAEAINHLLGRGAVGTFNVTGDGRPATWAEVTRKVFQELGADPQLVEPLVGQQGLFEGAVLDLRRIASTGFKPANSWIQLADLVPRHSGENVPRLSLGGRPSVPAGVGPFRVLFVCTANISRSAYAGVVAGSLAPHGVEFSSAGTHALVGRGIDPVIAQFIQGRGNPDEHRARQLTRQLAFEADLIIGMDTTHRRYILDEWPTLNRKTYSIGHVARGMASLPDDLTVSGLGDFLWKHRTVAEGDSVTDPYGRGREASQAAARLIDTHLDPILRGLATLTERD